MSQKRENWGSRMGFILAAAGSAIGLGNFWRFPYLTGENGGGIFIIIYIICIFVLGVPIMLSEMTIGRHTQLNAVGAFKEIKPNTPWFLVGGLGVLTGFLILSFYGVVAGWTFGYIVESIRGALSNLTTGQISDHFDRFISNPFAALIYFFLIIFLTSMIVVKGIKGGIERWSKILMPALFIMLLLVLIRSLTLPGAWEGVKFLFLPDFSRFHQSTLLAAMGQAFFSLSLGMGAMLTYGSYLSKKENMPVSSLMVSGLDLSASLLGSLALFPALFAFGMKPEQGSGLAFKTLPNIFNQIPLGSIVMPIFFCLLLIAALTSTISLLEVIVAYFVDEKRWTRSKAAWLMGGACFLLGVPSALSSGVLSAEKIGFSTMDIVNHLTADYMLPVGAFFISLFVGFAWGKNKVLKEVEQGCSKFVLGPVWIFIVRFLAPFIIGQIIILGIMNEFVSLKEFVERVNNAFSIIDAVLIFFLLSGTAVYLLLKKARSIRLKKV